MNSYEKWSLLINSLIALGIFAVILLSLFGAVIRKALFPAKLSVEILDKNGELTILDNGHRVIYYHLRIINRKSVIARNCRVFLKKIQMLHADGNFHEISMSVPPRYIWSPSETSPEAVDVVIEQIIDFGYVIDTSGQFNPTVTPILNSFKGNLQQQQTMRYFIEIVAENYRSKKLIGVEVSWDGKWPDNLNDMHQSLAIRMI